MPTKKKEQERRQSVVRKANERRVAHLQELDQEIFLTYLYDATINDDSKQVALLQAVATSSESKTNDQAELSQIKPSSGDVITSDPTQEAEIKNAIEIEVSVQPSDYMEQLETFHQAIDAAEEETNLLTNQIGSLTLQENLAEEKKDDLYIKYEKLIEQMKTYSTFTTFYNWAKKSYSKIAQKILRQLWRKYKI